MPASEPSEEAASTSQLSVLHQLTIIYLMLPVVVWHTGGGVANIRALAVARSVPA